MNNEQEIWNNEMFKIWKNSRLNWRSQNGVEEFEMEDDAQGLVYSPKGGSGEELEKMQTRENELALSTRRRLEICEARVNVEATKKEENVGQEERLARTEPYKNSWLITRR